MRNLWIVIAAVALIAGTGSRSEAQELRDNAEVQNLFEADQAARVSLDAVSGAVREAADQVRRDRMKILLDEGALQTANDYFNAALVFQHGRGDDCLLAHVLATTALSKGHPMAGLIVAATLDRYLQDIGRSQIYGTQFMIPFNSDPVTQEAYDRDLISDAMREAAGVPPLGAQEIQRRDYEIGRSPRPSGG